MKKYFFIFSLLVFSFLFLNISSAQAATLYYNNDTLDGDWNNPLNWWTDAGFISQGSVPTVSDDAIIEAGVDLNGGSAASVNRMTVNGTAYISIPVTVANGATFNNSSYNSSNGLVSGDATFNDSSINDGGTITGDATFNDDSYNNCFTMFVGCQAGTVSGDATFNDDSYNGSGATITGDATFNDTSDNDGQVVGNTFFNDDSRNDGTVGGAGGDATFNDNSYNAGTGMTGRHAFFYDLSYNDGSVGANATFNDLSYNSSVAAVNNDASFFDSTINHGLVFNNACFASTADQADGAVFGDINTTLICTISVPTITTNVATRLSSSSEDLFGEITDTGGESANTVGFQYGLTTNYGNTVSQAGAFVRAPFDSIVTALPSCGPWHFRAFATNSAGTSYGNDITFITGPCIISSGSGGGTTTTPPPAPITPPPTTISPPPTTTTPPAPQVNIFPANTIRTLRLKVALGEDIRALQVYLNTHGYPLTNIGPGSRYNETTKFGLLTYAAVMQFQRANNLVVDGIVGPKTLRAINNNL